MSRVEVSAKTVDEAVRSAIAQLGISEAEAEIEIVDEGAKGLFGIGGKDAKVIVTKKSAGQDAAEMARAFIEELIDRMDLVCIADVEEKEDVINVTVSGKGVGGIIGRRGETLDAVQYLTNLYVNKGKHGDGYKRVLIDSENYRAKREETLVRLANSMAAKALKYRREMKFEPMSAYERRVIHSALQSHGGVTTKSIGEEPYRKIVVSPK